MGGCARCPGGLPIRGRLLLTGGSGRVQHVLLADPAADTSALQRREVHVVLAGELADQWGDVGAALTVALGLCFLMVVLATQAGFSPALGAFIMGSILAETTEGERIEHLIAPVKDLFAAVFFVSVGMMIDPVILQNLSYRLNKNAGVFTSAQTRSCEPVRRRFARNSVTIG